MPAPCSYRKLDAFPSLRESHRLGDTFLIVPRFHTLVQDCTSLGIHVVPGSGPSSCGIAAPWVDSTNRQRQDVDGASAAVFWTEMATLRNTKTSVGISAALEDDSGFTDDNETPPDDLRTNHIADLEMVPMFSMVSKVSTVSMVAPTTQNQFSSRTEMISTRRVSFVIVLSSPFSPSRGIP